MSSQLHAGNLGDKDFAAVHTFDTAQDEMHSVFQREPEAGHAGIGDGDLASLALLQEHGNHAAPAAHDVAVAGATEARVLGAGVGVGLDKHFLRAKFGGAVEIDRD